MRSKLPFAGAIVVLVAAGFTPPLIAYLLIFLGFGLAMDAGTSWLARAGRTGGMKDFKQ